MRNIGTKLGTASSEVYCCLLCTSRALPNFTTVVVFVVKSLLYRLDFFTVRKHVVLSKWRTKTGIIIQNDQSLAGHTCVTLQQATLRQLIRGLLWNALKNCSCPTESKCIVDVIIVAMSRLTCSALKKTFPY